MLDRHARGVVEPALLWLGTRLARLGVSANALTLMGAALALSCAAAIVFRLDVLALALLLLNRLVDGLDGTVARQQAAGGAAGTDFGGILDIVCDFVFYGLVPLAFAFRDPGAHALAAAVLLFSFYVNGASFLAYAAIAAKRGLDNTARGPKAIHFTVGLMEGTETILFFVAFLLLPAWFNPLAYTFALACFITCLARLAMAWRLFQRG